MAATHPYVVIEAIHRSLVVSCQAPPGHPLRHRNMIVALAECARDGRAGGLRLDGIDDVQAVRSITDLPIIGIRKHFRTYKRPLITRDFADCADLVKAGADIVAVETTTEGPGIDSFANLAARVHDELDVPIMADVSTYQEGIAAWRAGADLVSTTLAGYTDHTRSSDVPDLELVHRLAAAGARTVLEGHVHEPEQAVAAIHSGAWAVVVGKAITDPLASTARFVKAMSGSP